jgi:class 3 adenylate cyclase/ActR/RegA family two-component response regulator
VTDSRITVLLADDNLIVREGVRTLISLESDLEVVGVAADYDELIAGAERFSPQVLVTDIRMPPNFQREGIEAAKQVRKMNPGTGVVILSQYDEPEYAISLLSEGSAGYGYLLKDRVAEGDQLARAIRDVATGGTALDPRIVEMLVNPVTDAEDLTKFEEVLLRFIAEGKSVKAIAAGLETTPADVSDQVEKLFLRLAQGAAGGEASALRRLTMLHQAIVDLEEQGDALSRFVPGGVAEKLRLEGRKPGESEELIVTVVMSDIRGYSTISETADPTVLAAHLNEHRAEMNRAVIDQGGTVMLFIGDAVMAVFGAPFPQEDHAERAIRAAAEMHGSQHQLNQRWQEQGFPPFGLGIGLSTGEVAAAILGSDERLEYTVIGDAVNLAQRIQQWAGPGETVLTEATYRALAVPIDAEKMEPATVKGRQMPVTAFRVGPGALRFR